MKKKPNVKKLLRGIKIAKNVNIKKVTKTKYGLRIEGDNPYQEFVEYFRNGKTVGMILRNKREKFWSVWLGDTVLTVKIPRGWKVIGSTKKSVAMRLLHKNMKGNRI